MGREARINKKLTVKQTQFVKGIISGKTATQAVMNTYNVSNTKTASVIASQNLNKVSVKEAIEEALRSKGLSVDLLAENISNLASFKPQKITADIVLRSNIELLKLHGAYPDKKSLSFSFNAKTQFNDLTFEQAKEELININKEVNELLTEA